MKEAFAYRKYNRKNINPYTLSAWLRVGKNVAQIANVNFFDRNGLKKLLPKLKTLATKKPGEYLPIIEEKLAEVGVVVVYMPKMKNTFVQGASRWIVKDKVLLMLNTHKRTEDIFWFNLYHELGHILLHGKRDNFIDYEENEKTQIEIEADQFAQKYLIPDFERVKANFFEEATSSGDIHLALIKIAKQEKISPDILAGRFAFESKNKKVYATLNQFLKPKINYQNI